MRLRENLLAGFANSVWSALVGLAVVPLYLKYLGIEAYGLIGFFVTTQALLQLLDMGIAPTINREVARCSASGNLKEAGRLLHSLAVVYWSVAGVIALLIVSLAPLIAEYWLQSNHLSQQTIKHAVMLMGLVIACRWPIGLYQGALVGAQRLTVMSSVSIAMVTFGNLGAVAVLIFLSPTIEAFFIWQACVGLLHAVSMRWAAWGVIGRLKEVRFDVDELKRIWRFSAGMSGIAVSGLVFTQLDKVILSKIVELKEFGHYMLATAVVSGLYLLIAPTFNVVYPRLSALVVTGDREKLTDLYRVGTRLLASVLFPVAMLLVVFPQELVYAWTRNQAIASSVAPIIALLAVGTALHGVMHFPYSLQLAYGVTRLPLTINAILIVVWIPLIIGFALKFGALGGAMAWLVLQVLYAVLGTWLTHRRLLKGVGRTWLFQDVGVPLGLSILVGFSGYYATNAAEYSLYVKLIWGAGLAIIASVPTLWLSPQLRSVAWNSIGWKKYSIKV
jgi:O-antigen/teichoic acid export membrane protein